MRKFLSKDNSYSLQTRSFEKRLNNSFAHYKGHPMQVDLINVTNLNQKKNGIKL